MSLFTDVIILRYWFVVSLENVRVDILELEKGMEMTKKEFEARKDRDPPVILKDFLANSQDKLKKLKSDCKLALVSLIQINFLEVYTPQLNYLIFFLLIIFESIFLGKLVMVNSLLSDILFGDPSANFTC